MPLFLTHYSHSATCLLECTMMVALCMLIHINVDTFNQRLILPQIQTKYNCEGLRIRTKTFRYTQTHLCIPRTHTHTRATDIRTNAPAPLCENTHTVGLWLLENSTCSSIWKLFREASNSIRAGLIAASSSQSSNHSGSQLAPRLQASSAVPSQCERESIQHCWATPEAPLAFLPLSSSSSHPP